MRLTDYCKGNPQRKREIAEECGVTGAAVTHWCNGTRVPQQRYWRAIVEVTRGEVGVDDLLDCVPRAAA